MILTEYEQKTYQKHRFIPTRLNYITRIDEYFKKRCNLKASFCIIKLIYVNSMNCKRVFQHFGATNRNMRNFAPTISSILPVHKHTRTL